MDCNFKDNKDRIQTGCPESICPRPCIEGEWLTEDLNWAVVNAYRYLYIVEKHILCSYNALLNSLHYGYERECAEEYRTDKAIQLRDVIKRELYRYKNDVKCLCKRDIELLFEKAERLEKCKTVASHVITQTDENWVKRNPYCASREDWEMYSAALCALWNLEITVSKEQQVQNKCNIALEITYSKQFCDLLVAVSLTRAACEIGIKPIVDKDQCKIEWKLLLEKYPECNIDLKTYILCKEEGFTYDMLQLILDSGLDLQSENGELFLKGLLQEYKVNDLSFSGLPAESEDTKEFYSNPKAFVDKYLKDYNLTQLLIEKIIKK